MVRWDRQRRFAAVVGIVGIVIELVAVALLATKRIPVGFGMPLVIAGMFVAFVPMFILSRSARRSSQGSRKGPTP